MARLSPKLTRRDCIYQLKIHNLSPSIEKKIHTYVRQFYSLAINSEKVKKTENKPLSNCEKLQFRVSDKNVSVSVGSRNSHIVVYTILAQSHIGLSKRVSWGRSQLEIINYRQPGRASRVNGDGQCSAKMVNFNHSPKSQLWIVLFKILQR